MTSEATSTVAATWGLSFTRISSSRNSSGFADVPERGPVDDGGFGEEQGRIDPRQTAAMARRQGPLSRPAPAPDNESQNGSGAELTEAMTDRRWEQLCSQVLSVSEEAVSDEDLLALLLSHGRAGTNSRRVATELISRFETLGSVISARSEQICSAAEVDLDTVGFLKLVRAAGTRLAREEISHRPVVDSWDKLIAYLRTAMAHETVEQFRILFLDRRNVLIADEVQHRGTIDHTPVYPREVVKRALALDASAIIMVHNHPSNHPAPSRADIEMTRTVREIVDSLGIVLHDHIVISRRGHTSFRQMGLLDAECSKRRTHLGDHDQDVLMAAIGAVLLPRPLDIRAKARPEQSHDLIPLAEIPHTNGCTLGFTPAEV